MKKNFAKAMLLFLEELIKDSSAELLEKFLPETFRKNWWNHTVYSEKKIKETSLYNFSSISWRYYQK